MQTIPKFQPPMVQPPGIKKSGSSNTIFYIIIFIIVIVLISISAYFGIKMMNKEDEDNTDVVLKDGKRPTGTQDTEKEPSRAEDTDEVGPSRAKEIIAGIRERRAEKREKQIAERERRVEEREKQIAERAAERARRLQEEDDDDTITIHIDENGSRYESTNSVETYIAFPNVPPEVSEYSVVAYNVNDIPGPPGYMGTPSTWDSENDACPDGTYDCLYYEKIVNGRVVGITDADGNSLIRKFIDDLYADRLTSYDDDFYQMLDQAYKLDDHGRLFFKPRGDGDEDILALPGVNIPIGMFVINIVLLHKYNGNPKPKIIVDFPARTMVEMRSELEKTVATEN